jgi:putative membrane protein
MTHHSAPIGTELLGVALLAAGWLYLGAARRGSWPRGRTARWVLGVAAALLGLAVGGLHDLRAHVGSHLLLAMAAPLLLVTAAPVTLALRTLPRRHARVVARLLRSRPATVLTHPAVAAVLDIGGLWLMYRTDLLAAVPPALVQVHMLLAGYLFAFSLVGPDPSPHRPGLGVRAGVLVAAVAAHDVIAKLVYATPVPGVPTAQVEAAGVLLYYGAAPAHVALFVLIGREWAVRQRRVRRAQRAPVPAAMPAASVAENASQSPGAAARISAGEGLPSTPPRTTPASRASSRPAATSQSLAPASTPQSNRPHAR